MVLPGKKYDKEYMIAPWNELSLKLTFTVKQTKAKALISTDTEFKDCSNPRGWFTTFQIENCYFKGNKFPKIFLISA